MAGTFVVFGYETGTVCPMAEVSGPKKLDQKMSIGCLAPEQSGRDCQYKRERLVEISSFGLSPFPEHSLP